MKPVEVRDKLVHALGLDLVGPDRGDTALLAEVLPQAPSRWYLTGFLIPTDAPESQNNDDTGDEGTDELGTGGGADDEATPEPAAARKAFFPSSMGMSLLVPKETKELRVTLRWGDYLPEGVKDLRDAYKPEAVDPAAAPARGGNLQFGKWRRTDRAEEIVLKLPDRSQKPKEVPVPNSGAGGGLTLATSVRPVKDIPQYDGLVPKGTRSVSVFLVNRRRPAPDELRDAAWVFQAALEVRAEGPFVARPNLRGLDSTDWDERVADLQYHDACEYAVGHGVATRAVVDRACDCREVHTRWLPAAEVERVAPADIADVELGMEALAALPDGAAAAAQLSGLVTQYRAWIEQQAAKVPAKPASRRETAELLVKNARRAADRIEAGVKLLAEPLALEAFTTANRVMAAAARRRAGPMQGRKAEDVPLPRWRPFQLAFLLMNLEGVARPESADRDVVDLLFFPTGGGKTEAYLGLAAFALVHRRLTNPGVRGAGLSIVDPENWTAG